MTSKIKWSSNFAYAIGLIASDGSLSKDGRHIAFTSKDLKQIKNFQKCLNLDCVKIGKSYSDSSGKRKYYNRLQFSDVLLYDFLLSIGIGNNKAKTISEVKVPEKYFFDFLRGSFDGDGTFYSYWDKRWKSSHMFYTTFSSSSLKHVEWIKESISKELKIIGHISKAKSLSSAYNLRYAKGDSLALIPRMYYNSNIIYLKRKKSKIDKAFEVEKLQQLKY